MRVLIVEDEGLIARFVARALQAEGYTTSVAPDGEVACRRLRDEEWDLAILDLLLPAKSGFDVLRELSQATNQVPVLVLSARRSVEDKVTALDAGATDFLAKPFALDELLARVRALLRRGRSPAETEPGCEPDLEFTLDGPLAHAVLGRRPHAVAVGARVRPARVPGQVAQPDRLAGAHPERGLGVPVRPALERGRRLRGAATSQAAPRDPDRDRPRRRLPADDGLSRPAA